MRESMWIFTRTRQRKEMIDTLKKKTAECYGWVISEIHFNARCFKYNGHWFHQAFFTVEEGIMIAIRDISDKGRKESKKLRYEVGVLHTASENENLDIVAKFRAYGDASAFATQIAKGNYWYQEVVIRS